MVGVVVAAGTPAPVIEKLAGWFNQITAAEDAKKFLADSAFDPFPGSPAQMQALLKATRSAGSAYIELAKIEPQWRAYESRRRAVSSEERADALRKIS